MKDYLKIIRHNNRVAARENRFVIVNCPVCGTTRKITAGEIAPEDFPLCFNDGMPMLPKKAEVE